MVVAVTRSLVGQNIRQYRVVEELGWGQHSVVYKAWQPSLERHVAIKVLRNPGPSTWQEFKDEARLTAYFVQHGVVNIRQVYQVDRTEDGIVFVALEFVQDSLHSLLQQAHSRQQRMSPIAAAELLRPVAEALDTIHRLGWVHLDIKPQNILLTSDGRTLLADFGISQRRGAKTHACTPKYASPEQAAGDRPVGPWSDVYSLAVVLYEMIAGHAPVRGDRDFVLLNQHLELVPPSPRKVNTQLTAGQERVLFKALSKSFKSRYRSGTEFLNEFLSAETFFTSIVQTPSAMLSTTSHWFRRIPRFARWIALAALLAVLVWLGWTLWKSPVPGTPAASTQVPVVTPVPAISEGTATPRVAVPRTPTSIQKPTVTLAPKPTLPLSQTSIP